MSEPSLKSESGLAFWDRVKVSPTKEEVKIYQGNTHKMDVLNKGEGNPPGHRAIALQLRTGLQEGEVGSQLLFGVDKKDGDRIVNADDEANLSDEAARGYANLQLTPDGMLRIQTGDRVAEFTMEQIKKNPRVVVFNDIVGLRVLGLNPESPDGRQVVVDKIKIRPSRQVLDALKRIGPCVLPFSTLLQQDAVDVQATQPPAIVRQEVAEPPQSLQSLINSLAPKEEPEVAPSPPEPEKRAILDKSLQCPRSEERTIAQGSSLTGELIKLNGLDRYLAENGKLDTQKLYKDLACLLVIPENGQLLHESDPVAADAVDALKTAAEQGITGPINNQMVHDAIEAINGPDGNRRVKGANSQLVIVQPGQTVLVPDFRPSSATE